MGRGVFAVLVAAACLSAVVPADAAPQPHIVDPRGDWPLAGQDVVTATFGTVGKGRAAALEIRVQLAGAPLPDAGLYWEVGWRTRDCALSYIEYTRSAYAPGDEQADLITQCRKGDPFVNGLPATGRLEGSTLVLTTPLARRYRPGTWITEPFAASFTFVRVAPGVPAWAAADRTDKGRAYRVGT